MVDTTLPSEDECRLLRQHVLSGDDAALYLATIKLMVLNEDPGKMKEILVESQLSPDRIDVMTASARGCGSDPIARDLQDAVVYYIRGWNEHGRYALLTSANIC